MSVESPPDPPPASRARFVLAGWLCALSAVLFLDRICIGQAAQDIQADLGLSNRELGYVFMAFTIAYGLFEVPTGRLGDRIGSRAVLTRVVVWWSAFTALTGAAVGLRSLLVVRFLFGADEPDEGGGEGRGRGATELGAGQHQPRHPPPLGRREPPRQDAGGVGVRPGLAGPEQEPDDE